MGLGEVRARLFFIFCQLFSIFDDFPKRSKPKAPQDFEKSSKYVDCRYAKNLAKIEEKSDFGYYRPSLLKIGIYIFKFLFSFTERAK